MLSNRTKLVVYLALAALASSAPAAEESAEALKQRVLALAQTVGPDDYAFTRTARMESSEGTKSEQVVMVERFDPRKPADQRWTLVSVDGRAPNADELKSHRKEAPKRRVPHYGRVANYFGAPAAASVDARGRTVFRFNALPKDSLTINNTDLSANAIAEAVVDASGAFPFVEQVRFTSTRPTRVMLVANVEKSEAVTRYRLMPDGKPVPMEQVSDMTGSMLGKSGRIKTVVTYSEHRAAR